MSDAPEPAEPDDDTDTEETLPETTSLTDPKSQRLAHDKLKREAQERASLWRAVLAEKTGRREVWRLLTEARTFNTDFACGPNGFPQPEATWHNLGRQQWGLKFYHELLVIDHDAIRLMHTEHDARFMKPKRQARQRSD